MTTLHDISIRPAGPDDVPAILSLIRGLAEYERLSHECEADEAALADTLFGDRPCAEVVIAEVDGEVGGFALFFHNYSTFLARPGLYLEDLFVQPRFRGLGLGKRLMVHLARLAVERGCGRFE
ncbi:MAG: GNAT family N-acetyltransferase, partial [Devosia sp.]|nr:GNAT family N-acetyltransferase [Devosia sp.]